MPSRAAAVRELLKRGLAAKDSTLAGQGAKSSDYGVTDPATKSNAGSPEA